MKATFGSTAIWKIFAIFVALGPLAMSMKSYSHNESIGSLVGAAVAALVIVGLIFSIYKESKKNITSK